MDHAGEAVLWADVGLKRRAAVLSNIAPELRRVRSLRLHCRMHIMMTVD
ncbi:MAG: hypothetical protein P4L85_01715 [Paludisphaera borealis]|nr:hypothetical protein [Paludisphaera borealis]MDR3618037.1 hypothetical protein [Paludisphaera borealis]